MQDYHYNLFIINGSTISLNFIATQGIWLDVAFEIDLLDTFAVTQLDWMHYFILDESSLY